MTFRSLLIANRGEIACRIIRSANEAGYRTIAIYSDADADALHVSMADEAVHIGPAPAQQSYLDIQKIVAAARSSGAEAVHPGYGFLSENADFAEACARAGLIFVGPSASAIRTMGSKSRAKEFMKAAGVPCIPGYEGADQSVAAFEVAAQSIGYPVMVKAAAGGGGRGMRLVLKQEDLSSAIHSAKTEAAAAFGSDELILEKALLSTRHVEVQVLADAHGSVIHLGERDCSIQRRHQKVIEEAPSSAVSPALREKMGAAAIAAARAVDYRNAGTIEFLLDLDGAFYFMEMNTRLQVEHPVTELVTGLDLVKLQLDIAAGECIPLRQEDISLQGYAIEARICAEEPAKQFLPRTGSILVWDAAATDGIRVDTGVQSGTEISRYYDSMIAKIIAHGATREDARKSLAAALERLVVLGVPTNTSFVVNVLNHPKFVAGEVTTGFIAENMSSVHATQPTFDVIAIAAVIWFNLNTLFGMGATRPLESISVTANKVSSTVCLSRRVIGFEVSGDHGRVIIDRIILHESCAFIDVDGVRREIRYAASETALHLKWGMEVHSFKCQRLEVTDAVKVE